MGPIAATIGLLFIAVLLYLITPSLPTENWQGTSLIIAFLLCVLTAAVNHPSMFSGLVVLCSMVLTVIMSGVILKQSFQRDN